MTRHETGTRNKTKTVTVSLSY